MDREREREKEKDKGKICGKNKSTNLSTINSVTKIVDFYVRY